MQQRLKYLALCTHVNLLFWIKGVQYSVKYSAAVRSSVQVLGWLQPYLTDQFIKLAFHPDTFTTNPQLIELERGRSNENPPYMFRSRVCLSFCICTHTF